MAEPNRITIYSSGMADFVRSFPVKVGEETPISIPVQESYIGDVLASLKVYGKVRILRPPAFSPRYDVPGILEIDPTQAQEELLSRLSGSAIKVTARGGGVAEGRLMGRDTRIHSVGDGGTVPITVISILVGRSIKKFLLDDLTDIEFTDDKAQSEIEKALDGNYRKVKEGTAFLEFGVETLEGATEDATVLVQYMKPMAAPKHTYRISTGDGHDPKLELLAVVDNNTTEDLDDFLFTVVNGQPISFSTDLATVRIPRRGHIDVVEDSALGAQVVEESYLMELEGRGASQVAARNSALHKDTMLRMASTPAESSGSASPYASLGVSNMSQAVREEADTREVGDFQMWMVKSPITIKAKMSAVIPLFSQDAPGSRPVLVYKPGSHATRPFRAIKFVNKTTYSLSKGVASVYQDGVNVGMGILEDNRPGDEKLILHQLETRVQMSTQRMAVESRVTHIKVADGTYVSETLNRAQTTYTIHNKGGEEFRLFIEQEAVLGPGSEFVVKGTVPGQRIARLAKGWHLVLTVAPKQSLKVDTVESQRASQEIRLNDSNFMAYFGSVSDIKDNPKVREAIELQAQVTSLNVLLKETQEARTSLLDLQNRVKGFLASAPQGKQRDNWVEDIGQAEVDIRKIDKETIPGINKEIRGTRGSLAKVLKEIAASWDPDPVADPDPEPGGEPEIKTA